MRQAVVIVLAGLAVAGCGAAARRPSAAMPTEPGNTDPGALLGPDAAAARAEITTLMERTDRDLAELGAAPIAPSPRPAAMAGVPDIVGRCTPPAAPPAACADIATIAERVCDAATRICDLAEHLPGDAWASERCHAGTQACDVAHQRACDCQ